MLAHPNKRLPGSVLMTSVLLCGTLGMTLPAAANTCEIMMMEAQAGLERSLPGIERDRAMNLMDAAARAQAAGNEGECRSELGQALDILVRISDTGSPLYNEISQQQYDEERMQTR
jgi:hypothetical protein